MIDTYQISIIAVNRNYSYKQIILTNEINGKMSETTTQQFQLRLPSDLKESIESEALRNNRSVNAQILFMLQSYEESNGRLAFLPIDIKMRLEKYQIENEISTEEAIQKLLNEAMQSKDTITDILDQLSASSRKDLRLMARDILATHPLVSAINISDDELSFSLKNGFKGKVKKKDFSYTYSGYDPKGNGINSNLYGPTTTGYSDSTTTKCSSSLDDEIPF